ncbi:MAG: aldehyde dehydrogenase family protein [Amphiplicatus sp.]
MPDNAPRPSDAEIVRLFARQKAAFAADPFPACKARLARLDSLIRAVGAHEARIVKAINDDFGTRAGPETIAAEILMTLGAAKTAKRHLARWMRPRPVRTPVYLLPARSRIEPQPKGVVGIVSPWNYPVQLALAPAIAALAAGDRVMVKSSETTPATADLLRSIVAAEFDEDLFAVVAGGADTGAAFARLPFDHLLFTGGTQIGRKVGVEAAKNLTPATLELGGKSPAIIDDSADLSAAARAIAYGKLFNAGQTCIAPDYVLVPREKSAAAVRAIGAAARALYPEIDSTADYTAIVSDRHFARLCGLLDEARGAGAQIVEIGSANALHPQRKLPFAIVVDPPEGLGLMREEIFGPILPVIGVSSREAAIAHVNKGARPLALYWFGRDKAAEKKILTRTIAGGVTVNGTLLHAAQEHLPFGGVGASGMGAYHGRAGFDTFSHLKPVLRQSRLAAGALLHPPFGGRTKRVLKLLRSII